MEVLWKMTFQGGVFIIMTLILRLLLLDRLPKRAFTVLWTAATVRLLVPVFVPAAFSLFNLGRVFRLDLAEVSAAAVAGALDNSGAGRLSLRLAGQIDRLFGTGVHPVRVLWLAGAALCALAFLIGHLRGRRTYAMSLPVDDPFVDLWLEENRMNRPVEVRCSDRIAAPLTYGVLRPVVVLPRTMDWADRETLAYVLAHEFHHIRRFDALRKWFLAAALCIHWFNPLVWVMYITANRDLELDCDEDVVNAFSWGSRSDYARTLIGLEERRSLGSPFVSYFSKSTLEARVRALMAARQNSGLRLIAAGLVVVVMAAVCGTSGLAAGNLVWTQTPDICEPAYDDPVPTSEPVQEGPADIVEEVAEDGTIVRYWKDGTTEYWSDGMVEYWKDGRLESVESWEHAAGEVEVTEGWATTYAGTQTEMGTAYDRSASTAPWERRITECG